MTKTIRVLLADDHTVVRKGLRLLLEGHPGLTVVADAADGREAVALAEQHLRMIQRKGAALLIYVDLDDLKMINDSYGHLEGNRASIVTANVLRACFRQSDILARLGGDEFCVLMTDAGQDSALQVRKRLQHRQDFINALSSWNFRLSLSVGIADVPAVHQPPLDQLLRTADAQMYEEKRRKRLRTADSPALKTSAFASSS